MLIGKLSWRNHFFYTKSKNKRQKMVNATLKTHDKISLKLIIQTEFIYLACRLFHGFSISGFLAFLLFPKGNVVLDRT